MIDAGPVLLVGCGGHGRVVLDTALASGLNVTGIVDGGLEAGRRIFGIPVLGDDQFWDTQDVAGAGWLNGVGANPDTGPRRAIYDNLSKRFMPHGVQHPSATVGRMASVGKGVQLMAGVVLQNGTSIGDNSVVNTGAHIDHDCEIGQNCFVAPGATLCGAVVLEEGVFVGAAAVIVPGITIGKNAVLGAGSVVIADVRAGTVVAGNPAKVIRWGNK